MVNVIVFVMILLQVSISISTEPTAPQLTASQGQLKGQYLLSTKGKKFSSFTGIPYVKAPLGALRFQPPQPAEAWSGVLDATVTPPVCSQVGVVFASHDYVGQEDCLYLNVYTPEITFPTYKKLPVMVFIHGGGLMFGSGIHDAFGPELLMNKQNVVLVTMNYRLGVLGFLSTGNNVVPGNNGLKDQNMALKWVKSNIAHFGGDPNLITLFGQSAGGASVEFHMISPLSKDLIKRAISESGAATAAWGLSANGENQINSLKLADMFGCPTANKVQMVECLRGIDAEPLTVAQLSFGKFLDYPIIPFKPVVERNVVGAMLPKSPIELIKSGNIARVPYIIGINAQDGGFFSPQLYSTPGIIDELNDNSEEVFPYMLDYARTGVNKNYITRQIKKFYFGNAPISNSTRPQLNKMFTDRYFFTPVNDMVKLHWQYTQQPVYYYDFAYHGSESLCKVLDPAYVSNDVCHFDELLYLLPSKEIFPNYVPTPEDEKMSDILTTIWTHFAATGKPTPEHHPLIHAKWKPVQSSNLEYYYIKSPSYIKMEDGLYRERANFWKTLPIYPIY